MSCERGTPERKIIDAFSEALSEAYVDQYLVGSLLDLEGKIGLELEQFCLVAGTPVTTPVGVKSIEALRQGDEVITHTGKVAEVLATSARVVDEDVVTIRTAVGVEYTMTKNHPVWITRRSDMTLLASQVGNWRRDGSKEAEHALRLRGLGNKTVWDSRGLDRDFVPAGEVAPGDIVWGPDPGLAGVENTLSVGLKRLLGYYLAEGHIHHRPRSSEIGFSFHRDEIEYQNEVEALLRSEWGITHIRRQHPSPNSTQLICYDTRLAHWLQDYVGKGATEKHIPFGLETEDWTPLLATYWCGDGTAAKKQSLRAKTVSPTLAWQLYDQMIRLGLSPRMVKSNDVGPATIMGRMTQRRATWQISVDGASAQRLSEIIDYPLRHQNNKNYAPVSVCKDGFVGSAVIKTTESRYRGSVHNIEVAGDNSYELPGSFGVHNCGIFGFGRLQGKASTGVVRMTVATPLITDQVIPLGSQFFTKTGIAGSNVQLYFASIQAVVLVAGTYSVDVPVECTVVGTIGNLPPDSVTSLGSALATSTVTNLVAFSGGVDVETDQELRQRFRDTLLRNIAGTRDWYRAICQQSNKVSKVVVFGPTQLYKTQITVASSVDLSDDQNIKYAWPEMESVFTNLGQEDEVFYNAIDDYTFTPGGSPSFDLVGTGELEVGDIVDVEFQYTPVASRNDPVNGITNKVDIFVNGIDPYTVTEKTVVTAQTLSASSSVWNYTGNFNRIGTAGSPSSSNRFTRLGSVPIVSFPASIVVGDSVYELGTHYHILYGTTEIAGSHFEIAGIEWDASGPANDTELELTYIYNRVPELLSTIIGTSKQITTDVMVHQAYWRYIIVCMTVQYDRSYSVQVVNAAIQEHVTRYFASLEFGAHINIATLSLVVQQVLGVKNVHLTTDAENPTHYGVEVYDDPTDTEAASVETTDFQLNGNALPVFQSIRLTREPTP